MSRKVSSSSSSSTFDPPLRPRRGGHFLSQSEVLKLVNDALPRGRAADAEAVSFVNAACVAFIREATRESTRVCAERQLKTLTAESFALALEGMGCGVYAAATATPSSATKKGQTKRGGSAAAKRGSAAAKRGGAAAKRGGGGAAKRARSALGKRKLSAKEQQSLARKQARLFAKAKKSRTLP